MTGKKVNKHHMTDKDIEQAKKLLADGWPVSDICGKLKISRYKFDQTMLAERKKEKIINSEMNFAVRIREDLEKNDIFGKNCEETDKIIVELLRKGTPEVLIAHLLGLNYDSALDAYEEYNDSLQNKVRKQAKAEHFITELLKFGDTADSKGKLDYLKILKESKDDFNTSKDDKSNVVRIIFTNFDRDKMADEVEAEQQAKTATIN
jgi:hypothetical protein